MGKHRRCSAERVAIEWETLLVASWRHTLEACVPANQKKCALYLDGKNFIRSSWKSTFSSFLHLVFRTRADRRFAVSPLSSEIFFRFTPFLDLSPPETSPSQRVHMEIIQGQGMKTQHKTHRSPFITRPACLIFIFFDVQAISHLFFNKSPEES